MAPNINFNDSQKAHSITWNLETNIMLGDPEMIIHMCKMNKALIKNVNKERTINLRNRIKST